MKYRSILLVSAMLLTLALTACAAQATPTALPAATTMAATQVMATDAMTTDTMPAATAAMTTAPATGSGTQVDIANFAFSPATLTVKVGTTITWTNKDSAAHTVTSDTGLFDSGNMPQGKTFSYTFTTAGTYAYHCTYHAMMKGTVVVTN